MKTTINNNQRVFVIINELNNDTIFCNLVDIPRLLKTIDHYSIMHFWDFKFKRCSKKLINEMFENNNIDFKIK
jgi:hypothetical protein